MNQIVLLSENEKDLDFFQEVAKFAQMGFKHAASAEEICELLQANPQTVIVLDTTIEDEYMKFENTVAEKIGLFNALINPNTIFFVDDHELNHTPALAYSELFGTFIPRRYTNDNIPIIARLVLAALQTSESERSLALSRFFSSNAKVQTIKVNRSIMKQAIVQTLKNHLVEIGFKVRVADIIAVAADEIIMNAIFDAPVDEAGKYIYLQTPRNKDLILDDRNIVEFSVAYDGRMLGISVQDQHGSLDKKKLLRHISKSYANEEFKLKTNVAGAGLGLSNVYRNCGGIIFECEQGMKTQVTILYRKTDSFKDFKDQFRFISTLVHYQS